MRLTLFRGLTAALAFSLLPALAGCHSEPPPTPEPPPVEVSLPDKGEIANTMEFQARTNALYSVDILAQVTGYLTKIYFKEGDEVIGSELQPQYTASLVGMMAPAETAGPWRAAVSMTPSRVVGGDPLYRIDPDQFKAAVAKAQADVADAKALVIKTKAAYDILVQSGKGSSLLDRTQAEGSWKQAQAQVLATTATLDKATKDLSFCFISAPLTGKISSYKVTEGNLVLANQTALTNIVANEFVWATFELDEDTLQDIRQMVQEGKVKSYQSTKIPVKMRLANNKTTWPFSGVIDFIDNKVNPGTATIVVRAKFDNPLINNTVRALTPGLFCRVQLTIGDPEQRLLVSDRAIGQSQNQKYVYVVNDKNEVEYRGITTGRRLENGLVVVDNLAATDRVIVNGMSAVRPGAVVRISQSLKSMPTVTGPPPSNNGKVVAPRKS